MKLVIDASVAIKWLVDEPKSDLARGILDSESLLIAPELVLAEVANIAWRKQRRGEITAQHAVRVVALVAHLFDRLWPLAPLASAAFDAARTIDQPVYDAFCLALGMREATVMVTDDARLLRRLSEREWHGEVRALETWPGETEPSTSA